MTSRVEEMKKTLIYCEDRGVSLATSLVPTERILDELRKVFTRIDCVDRNLPPETQLRDRVLEAECDISKNTEVTYPQALARVFDRQEDLVANCLASHSLPSGSSPAALAIKICKSYLKIFAILLKMRRVNLIIEFLNESVDDSSLPISYERRDGRHGVLLSGPMSNGSWVSIAGMDKEDWRTFHSKQCSFVVPFFAFGKNGDVLHYKLESWDIVPITSNSERAPTAGSTKSMMTIDPIDGGHSTVTKIKLHPLCTGFGDYRFRSKEDLYALKTLKDKSQLADFLAEVYFWKLWNGKSGDALEMSPLLCTWEKKDEQGNIQFCLLFPFASGDLRQLWRGDNGAFSQKWLIEQCCRLAETLSFIHQDSEKHRFGDDPEELYGRHGDIKPENILWFANHSGCDAQGTLVLADFGVSKCHRAKTKSLSDNWHAKHSPTYRAPEYDLAGRKIGRKADIWALGCTWLEFVSWLLRGPDAVDSENTSSFPNFRGNTDPNENVLNEDTFFVSYDRKTARVTQQVCDWVDGLRSDCNCNSLLRQLIDYIMNRMLVVDDKKRDAAWEVAGELRRLNESYTTSYP